MSDRQRVTVYLPSHLVEVFEKFKEKRWVQSDSAALIAILEEYFQARDLDDKLQKMKAEITEELLKALIVVDHE